MAEGDGYFFTQFKLDAFSGEHILGQDKLYMMLVTGYTPDYNYDTIYDQVSGEECSGGTYGKYGLPLSGESFTLDYDNKRSVFDAWDVNWDELDLSGNEPSHCILYNFDHPLKKLIACWEVTTETNGGDYILQFAAAGVMTFT